MKKSERSEKKEVYKYLEVDTIKDDKDERKIKMSVSGQCENFSEPKYIAEI